MKPSDLEAFVTSFRRKQNKAIFLEAETLPLVSSSSLTSNPGALGEGAWKKEGHL